MALEISPIERALSVSALAIASWALAVLSNATFIPLNMSFFSRSVWFNSEEAVSNLVASKHFPIEFVKFYRNWNNIFT